MPAPARTKAIIRPEADNETHTTDQDDVNIVYAQDYKCAPFDETDISARHKEGQDVPHEQKQRKIRTRTDQTYMCETVNMWHPTFKGRRCYLAVLSNRLAERSAACFCMLKTDPDNCAQGTEYLHPPLPGAETGILFKQGSFEQLFWRCQAERPGTRCQWCRCRGTLCRGHCWPAAPPHLRCPPHPRPPAAWAPSSASDP